MIERFPKLISLLYTITENNQIRTKKWEHEIFTQEVNNFKLSY